MDIREIAPQVYVITGQADDERQRPKSGTVCGRTYRNELAGFANERSKTGRGKMRFLVDGITHSGGQQIRFKSLRRAENHIINMGLDE